ncbi:MAG: nitroreductase family protein [Thermoplasmata archaeon]|nr:MAG: nitroreductase family protein [Aciduliprofundum sp.]HEU13223.1 nitroreductase family protein [Euryarchaeota archaeon]
MKSCIDVIFQRRSIRNFKNDPVPDEILFQLIRAAQYAPSSWNRQPWRFIVIREREKLKTISGLLPYGKFLSRVPMAIAIVASERESDLWLVDGSIAAQNLMLAAENFDLGTCWIAECDKEEIKRILELPEEFHIITITPLGYPAVKPNAPKRKDLKEVLFLEKFGKGYL